MLALFELLAQLIIIGYVLIMPLIYTSVLHFIVLRKSNENLKFWKNYMIYMGILIVISIVGALLMNFLISIDPQQIKFIMGSYVKYINIVLSIIASLFVGLLGGILIKDTESDSIGMKASFTVVGIIFLFQILFKFALINLHHSV